MTGFVMVSAALLLGTTGACVFVAALQRRHNERADNARPHRAGESYGWDPNEGRTSALRDPDHPMYCAIAEWRANVAREYRRAP